MDSVVRLIAYPSFADLGTNGGMTTWVMSVCVRACAQGSLRRPSSNYLTYLTMSL